MIFKEKCQNLEMRLEEYEKREMENKTSSQSNEFSSGGEMKSNEQVSRILFYMILRTITVFAEK